jgi:hypothetical protein
MDNPLSSTYFGKNRGRKKTQDEVEKTILREEGHFLQFPTLVRASSGSMGIISGQKPPLQVS